jgi:hypothetical protein
MTEPEVDVAPPPFEPAYPPMVEPVEPTPYGTTDEGVRLDGVTVPAVAAVLVEVPIAAPRHRTQGDRVADYNRRYRAEHPS